MSRVFAKDKYESGIRRVLFELRNDLTLSV